jgi:hypothetical protein
MLNQIGGGNLTDQEINKNGRLGYLVAVKGGAQFIFNPFVTIITKRSGIL